MTSSKLVSIQVAKPQQYGHEGALRDDDQPWRTAFFKQTVAGPVDVGWTNLAGDGQADLENHGGINKAVLAYSAEHYPYWRDTLGLAEMPCGAFGENLTITGLDETSVCVGDTWRIGDVLLQVSQPRQPCWKLSRRWRIADLAKQVIQNGRSGWYFRVLQTGVVEAGMPVTLQERPLPDWTIARANETFYHRKQDVTAAKELAGMPLLSMEWREMFAQRLGKRTE